MTCVNDNRLLVPAWGISLTLHGIVVVLAMLFAAQVRPIVQEEPFKWDVALVESVSMDSALDPTPEPAPVPTETAAAPAQPSPPAARRPVEPPPDAVMHRVAPQQTVQMVHPEVTPAKPVEQREEPVPLKAEPVTPPVKAVQEKPAEPIEQQVVEAPGAQSEPVKPLKEADPVPPVEPVIAHRQPAEAVESRSVEAPAQPSAPEPVASLSPVEPAPASASSPSPAPSEAPVQTAKAAPSGPEVKTDHRWLLESLHRRVSELQRYPSSARLNGQEGKVVLKAVIRSDGHLAEVSVQKSSGHQILDAAAMEVVKLACPLHMKHAMGKPLIVVSVPIVYSLTN